MVDTLAGNLINIYSLSGSERRRTTCTRPRQRQTPEEVETLCIGVPDKLKYLADSARFVFAHRTVGILMRFG